MPTKRELTCLQHIPTHAAADTWRSFQEKREQRSQFFRRFAEHKTLGEDVGFTQAELTLMRATGLHPDILFEMPKYLRRERMRKLADLYFAYLRTWENTAWRIVFGEWARTLETDIAAIARGMRANPKAGYRDMAEADLRKLIWAKHIRPQLPPDFIFEFAWLGPPVPEEVDRLSEPEYRVEAEEYFREVNKIIREVGIARDVAARWTRLLIQSQGFDVLEECARVWDDLVLAEDRAASKTDS